MLFDRIKRFYTGYTRHAGLQVDIDKDGKCQLHLVVLNSNNGKITIEKSGSGIKFEELSNHIDKSTAVAVVVTGKGVITKKLLKPENVQQAALLSVVLPNSNTNDFITETVFSGEDVFIAVIRKDQFFSNVYDVLIKQEVTVTDLKIGPLVINEILYLLNNNTTLYTGSYAITIEEGKLIEFKQQDNAAINPDYLVSGLGLNKDTLLPFSVALYALINMGSHYEATIPDEIKKASENFRYGNLFKFAGWTLLLLFMFILLINTLFYYSAHEEHQLLASYSGKMGTEVEKIKKLETTLKDKEQFLKETGWLTGSRLSWYADQLTGSIPAPLLLTELSVNPLDQKESRNLRKLLFEKDIVRIKGQCSHATDLNDWILQLQLYSWIKEVKLANYTNDSKTGVAS
ncbi:MAG TPA: hypothetical protein VNW06_12045, partial [Cytophagaceae bacterium]|nr:hypothetical protein [Cytophagaceae bacterium]